ncbi:MAG: alpha/beta hydrolase [Eubacteriales bacterium]|nr:alpha/beta hydrolase [Eubacteriales bacterium]
MGAFNGLLRLPDGGEMDYIRFGSGEKTLVMIPGVGDGFKTVKGTAQAFSMLYRKLGASFTVYVFSRRRALPEPCSTREMADDLAAAMRQLGLSNCCLLGVSQGGMITQYLAIDHPELAERLILAVTCGRPNETTRGVIGRWLEMAEAGDYKGILLDTAERSYSEAYLRRSRAMYTLLGTFGKPRSFERFRIQAESCLAHDAWEELPLISCPTLVIGATEDKIVTGEASRELAGRISDARLWMYEGLSHGAYEEAKDFQDRVAAFFLE